MIASNFNGGKMSLVALEELYFASKNTQRWITYPNGNFPALHRRKDYLTILRSEHAFRAAYVNQFRPEEVNQGNTYRYPESLKDNIAAIESLRKLILNPLLLGKQASLYVTNEEDIECNLITDEKQLAKKNPSGTKVTLFSIEAILPKLTNSLGIKYEFASINLYGKRVKAFLFSWQAAPMRYKIDPMPLALAQNKDLELNVTLIAKDGSELKADRSLLTLNDSAISPCFSQKLKESETGRIQFPEYTQLTLQAYLDCQRQGGLCLLRELLKGQKYADLNIMELLSFAHAYQIQDLLNCCINYLALKATAEDCNVLEEAGESYHLPQLALLAEKLRHPERDKILQELMNRQKIQLPPPRHEGLIRV